MKSPKNDSQLAAYVVKHPDSKSLYLEYAQITDAGLEHLSGLESLRVLHLTGSTAITDAGVVHLIKLANLALLYLGGTHVTEKGVKMLLEHFPNLKVYR